MTYGPVTSPAMPKLIGPTRPPCGAGDFLFISGQPGLDPASRAVPAGAFEAEAR